MKVKFIRSLFLLPVALIFISSCNKDDQRKEDQQLIEEYIAAHAIEAQSTSSGLYYVIDVPGTSEHPTLQDVITIAYTGKLLDGSIFDSSSSSTFPLNALIEGWQEGIPLFGKGGKGTLILPSHLGYGDRAYPGIPANSVLVFDIELIDF